MNQHIEDAIKELERRAADIAAAILTLRTIFGEVGSATPCAPGDSAQIKPRRGGGATQRPNSDRGHARSYRSNGRQIHSRECALGRCRTPSAAIGPAEQCQRQSHRHGQPRRAAQRRQGQAAKYQIAKLKTAPSGKEEEYRKFREAVPTRPTNIDDDEH